LSFLDPFWEEEGLFFNKKEEKGGKIIRTKKKGEKSGKLKVTGLLSSQKRLKLSFQNIC
jgi:hypothetical protein